MSGRGNVVPVEQGNALGPVIGSPFGSKPAPLVGGAYCFFIFIVIRHETLAAAGRALLFIVRTLSNDTIAVAVWTGFHVCLPLATSASLTRHNRLCTRLQL